MSGINKSKMYEELEGKSNQEVAKELKSMTSREKRCEVRSVIISLRKEETGLVGKSDDEAKKLLEEMKAHDRVALMRSLELSVNEEDNSDKGGKSKSPKKRKRKRKRLKPHVQVERILEEMRDGCPSLQTRLMNANDADKMANVRANETAEKRRTRLEGDAANRANVRARERAKISNSRPTYDTKVWELHGKDFTLKGHENDVPTAQILFHSNSRNPGEPLFIKLMAYQHVIKRLWDRGDMCAVAKLVDLFGLSLERRECLVKTICDVIPDELYKSEYLKWEGQTEERQKMNRCECELEWFATTDVVSLDESRTKISIPWIRTLIGLHLIVPGHWWDDVEEEDKSKLWRCEIDSINDTDKEEKYFGIKCHGDGVRYWIKYETIKKYVDTDHVDYPKYDLPEKQPSVDQELNARCEQTLRRLKDPNASLSSKVDICDGHCLRDVGRFIASHKISPKEAALLISRYCAAQGRGLSWGAKPSFPWNDSTLSEAPLPTCSCCGVRTFHIDNSDTKDDESDKDVIEGMGLRGEAFGSTRRTYQEVEVDQELINKLRLREGDEDIEIEEDPVESNDVEEIDHGEDSNGDRGIESNDNQDKCELTGPRSRRTQGYHRRLMEREPLCIPCNDHGDTKEVELWRLRSVWPAKKPEELEEEKDNLPEYMFDKEGNPVYLHLHPEFVREDVCPGQKNRYYATICSYCKKSLDGKKSPWRSIVSGVDFGDGNRIGLEPLTERERQMVSKVRHFLLVVKIESNTADGRVIERGQSAVKGCGIYFNHDSPRVVSDLLSEDSMNGDVSLQFVGPEGEYDALAKKVLGSANVEGRAWVVCQWLKVLQEVNCHYQYDDKLPEFEEVRAKIKAANEALVSDAEFVNDDRVVRETEIAKDDARHIRTHGGVENDVDDMEVEELDGGKVDFPMRCSYITHTKAGSGKDADRDYLESAAEAMGVDAKEFAKTLSRREGTPLNEYENGDGILAKACPDVCIFGTAYNSSRPTLSTYQTSSMSADTTLNSSEELCGQLTLLDKLINHLRHAKQYYETGSSQEVQRELLEFFSDTPPSTITTQTQRTMKTFRPKFKDCSPSPIPRKSGDGGDDQCRDEPSCNSSSSTVDEDDVGSESSSSSMSTSMPPHGTDQRGNCILRQEGENSDWPPWPPPWPGSGSDTNMNSRSDRSEASDDTSNLAFGVRREDSPDFSFCQQVSEYGSMKGYLIIDIEEMSFLEVLRSIHGEAPHSLDIFPQTPNITCPLQAMITLSRRRTAYNYKKLAGDWFGMMLEIQMVVSELQSICVDLRTLLRTLPDSQGQSGAKLPILQQIKKDQHKLLPILLQIEDTLSKAEYEFETIFDGIGLRVYILKKWFEKLHSNLKGHSVEFDDIMDFVIDAMMTADNLCPNLENSVAMDDDLIDTIYAEYQSLLKHDKLLYQFVGFVLIQFVFSDSVAVDAVAQHNGPTSPLPLTPKQPMGYHQSQVPSLTTAAAGAGIGGQPAPRLDHSVSAPPDLHQGGGLTSSVGGVYGYNNFTQAPPLPSAGDQVQQQLLPPTTQGQHAASHAGFGDAVAQHNGPTLTPPLPFLFLAPRKQPMVYHQSQVPSLTTAGAGIGGQPAPRLDHSVSAPPDLHQGGGLTSSVGGVYGYNNFTQAPPLPSAGDQVQQQLLPPTTQGQHAASHAGFGDAVAQHNGPTLTPPLPFLFLAPRKQPMVYHQSQVPSLTTAGAGIGGQPAPRLDHSVSAPPDLHQGGGLTSSVGGVYGYNNFTRAPPLPSAGDQVQQQLLPPTTQGQLHHMLRRHTQFNNSKFWPPNH